MQNLLSLVKSRSVRLVWVFRLLLSLPVYCCFKVEISSLLLDQHFLFGRRCLSCCFQGWGHVAPIRWERMRLSSCESNKFDFIHLLDIIFTHQVRARTFANTPSQDYPPLQQPYNQHPWARFGSSNWVVLHKKRKIERQSMPTCALRLSNRRILYLSVGENIGTFILIVLNTL